MCVIFFKLVLFKCYRLTLNVYTYVNVLFYESYSIYCISIIDNFKLNCKCFENKQNQIWQKICAGFSVNCIDN